MTIGLLANIFKKKDKNKQQKNTTKFSRVEIGKASSQTLDVYDNYTVRKTVNKIADLVASTPIRYSYTDTKGMLVEDTKADFIYLLQHRANDRLTSFKFLKQLVNIMLIKNDSFAWIHRDTYTGTVIELVPIITSAYTLITPEEMPDRLYIDFTLKDGLHKILPYNEVLHFTNDFCKGEFFGDNNVPLISIVSINNDLWNNLVSWTKDNVTIKGFLKTDSILNEDDMKSAKEEFSNLLKDNTSSYMTLDGKFDYVPVNEKSSPMDVNYIKVIESTITRFYSANSAVIEGNATPEQLETFHKICLVPIFTMMQQEFEAKFLTKKQIVGFNHKITFVCNTFEHMTATEKVSAYTLLTNTGVVSGNELRRGFGFDRVEGLDTYMYSKNYAQVGKTDETTDNNDKDNSTEDRPNVDDEKNNENESSDEKEENVNAKESKSNNKKD